MRINFYHFSIGLTLLTLATTSAQELGPHWMTDLAAAKAAAQQSGKLVLVHVWTPDCVPCSDLERNVFSQPQVARIMEERYVAVKINALESRSTSDALGVTRVPTDVILTPQGVVLDRSISPNSPAAYIAHVSQIASQHKTGEGTAFDHAVANAPVQVPNAAYGNLNIPNAGATQETAPASQSASAISPGSSPPTAIANPYVAAAPPMARATSPVMPEPNSAVTGQNSETNGSAPGRPAMGDRYAVNNSMVAPTTENPYARIGASPSSAPAVESLPNSTASTSANTSITRPASNPYNPSGTYGTPPTPQTPLQQQPTTSTAVASLPPGSPPLGFDGYCPVSIMRQVGQLPESQWKMIPGDARYPLEHRGKVYLFANEECRKAFYDNPDYYSPALAGLDPVLFLERSQSAPGTIKHGVEYNGQIYLFSSEQTLNRFRQHAEQYATGVRQAMQSFPGRMVR